MSGSDEAQAPDPARAMRERGKSPELAALLAWLVPGSGHLYAGHPVKGIAALVCVLGLHLAGLFLSRMEAVSLDKEEGHPYAFLAQIGVGLPTLVALGYTHGHLPGLPPARPDYQDAEYVARLPDVDTGLLFTMIAGLLNLLLVHDALSGVPGALVRRLEEERQRERLDAIKAEQARAAAPDRPPPPDGAADGEAQP